MHIMQKKTVAAYSLLLLSVQNCVWFQTVMIRVWGGP
jgi:hypothetical protein